MNQTWGGEPWDLLAAKGCRITVGAKLLHIVDETFGSIPIDSTKCRSLIRLAFEASTGRREPIRKREKGGGVPATCAGCLSDA